MVNILVVELDKGNEGDWKEILAFLSGKMHCQVSRIPLLVPSDEKNRNVLSFPGMEIRLKEQIALRDGEPVHLSHYEFFALCYLAQHPSWVFTKKQIYEAVWKQPVENCEASVSSVISGVSNPALHHQKRSDFQDDGNVGLHWHSGGSFTDSPYVLCWYLHPCGGVQYHAQNQSQGAGAYIQIQPGIFPGTRARTDQNNAV